MYEIVVILILLVINGLLAMSEIAFVSAKRFKIEEKAKRGSLPAKKALNLLDEPERFLSAIQIGITLVGILAGAFGGYAMAEDLTSVIDRVEILKPYSFEVSFASIVIFITYLSLVIGELVPKSIALNNPEIITLIMAPFVYFISKLFSPFVWFLSYSTKLIILLFRIKKNEEPPVSEAELKSLLELGTLHGTVEKEEAEIIKQIFSFNDKRVTDIMVPRKEIEWIERSSTNKEIFSFISTHTYSKYLVCQENIDNVIGIIESKEFLINFLNNNEFNLGSIISDMLVIPESIYSIQLIEQFRIKKTNIALIVDEYGGTQGIVTLHDLIENIVGEIPEKYEGNDPEIFERKDKSLLIDGAIDIQKLAGILQIEFGSTDYSTLGGFIMQQLGKIPATGDFIEYDSYRFEVVDMDGKRVDKVLVKKNIET